MNVYRFTNGLVRIDEVFEAVFRFRLPKNAFKEGI
jgi:hypothetical protein